MNKGKISKAFTEDLRRSFHAFIHAERATSLSVHQVAEERRSRGRVVKLPKARATSLSGS